MVVLKMKKYINDPNAPSCVLDAALDAFEENTNCEALYIQVCYESENVCVLTKLKFRSLLCDASPLEFQIK